MLLSPRHLCARLDAKLFGCATREFSRLMFVVDLDNAQLATSMARLKSALAFLSSFSRQSSGGDVLIGSFNSQ